MDMIKGLKFTTKGGSGSGHHGHAGRPGSIGGSAPSGGGIPGWEASMTKENADKWVATSGSKIMGAVYHATRPESIASIRENGMDPEKTSDTAWLGKGNYFAVGEGGRNYLEGDENFTILEARVSIRNPFVAETGSQKRELHILAEAFAEKTGRKNLGIGKKISNFLLANNYDGVIAMEFGHPIVVVLDKKQNVIIK